MSFDFGETGMVASAAILEEAVRAWLGQRASDEIYDRFAIRLDRISRTHDALEQRLDHLSEALQTFVQYELTLNADHPPFEAEQAALGRERAKTFREAVHRRLQRRLEIADEAGSDAIGED